MNKYISFYVLVLTACVSLLFGCDVLEGGRTKVKETTYAAKPKKQKAKPELLKPTLKPKGKGHFLPMLAPADFSLFFPDKIVRDRNRDRHPLRPTRETNQLLSRMRELLKGEGVPTANRGNFFNAVYNEETALLNGDKKLPAVLTFFSDAMDTARFNVSLKYSVTTLLDDYYLEFKDGGAAFTASFWQHEVGALFDKAGVPDDEKLRFYKLFDDTRDLRGSAFFRWGMTRFVNDKLNEFKSKYHAHKDLFTEVQRVLPEPYNVPKPTASDDDADFSALARDEEDVVEVAQVFTELLVKALPQGKAATSERASRLMGLIHDFVYRDKSFFAFDNELEKENVTDADSRTLYTYAKEWREVYQDYLETAEPTEPEPEAEAKPEPTEPEPECVPSWRNAYCWLSAQEADAEQSSDSRNTEVTRSFDFSTADDLAKEVGLFKYQKNKFTTWVHAAVFAHYRTDTDYTDVVRALVEAGELVNAPNRGVTPLFEAVHWHNNGGHDMTSMVLALLKAGADMHAETERGTPFEVAKELYRRYPRRQHNYVVELFEFFDEGFEGRKDGETLLHFAVRKDWNNDKDYSLVVYSLATGGEDVEATTHKGVTPLFEAVAWHNYKGFSTVETVQALLDAGANKDFETSRGTALELAEHMERIRPARDYGVVVSTLKRE